MDGLHERFEALVDALSTLSPVSQPAPGKEQLQKVEDAAHAMLETYVRARNPDAVISPMEGTIGGKLISSNKKRGRSGLSHYLDWVEAIPLTAGQRFYTPVKDFEMKESLQSYYINELSEEQKKLVYNRLDEGRSGAPVRLYNLVPMILLAIGKDTLMSRDYLRIPFSILKTCVKTWGDGTVRKDSEGNQFGDECDDNPYGRLRVTVDSMSPKKIYMCVNMANILTNYVDVCDYLQTQGINVSLMIHQMLSHYMDDPIGKTLKFKSHFGFCYMHSSALATTGSFISVMNTSSWSEYKKVEAPKKSVNADFWASLYQETFTKYCKEAREAGLLELEKLFRLSLRLPLNKIGYRACTFISALRGVTGYVGTDNNISFDEVYDHREESPVYKGVGLPDTYSRDSVGELIMPHVMKLKDSMKATYMQLNSIKSRIRMIDWASFVEQLPKLMTSNSAGIGSIVIKGKLDNSPVEIRATAKSILYALSPGSFRPGTEYGGPGKHLTMDEINVYYQWYSPENPGRMAERRVVAKASRPIEMQQLSQFIIELFFYAPFYRLMMRKNKSIDYNFNGSAYIITEFGQSFDQNIFATGSETGNVLIDHAVGFQTTGNAPMNTEHGRRLVVATDYSSYDQTEVFANMRIPFVDGVKEAFTSVFGESAYIGPFSSFDEAMATINPMTAAPFKLKNGKLVYLTGVRSGEYATMLYNNSMNASVCDTVMETNRMLGLGVYVHLKIQGDDVIAIIMIRDEGIDNNCVSHSLRLQSISDAVEGLPVPTAVAKSTCMTVNQCGLSTNPDKGVVAFNIYDFLKVRVMSGRYSPNNYAQLFGSESLGMSDSPQQFMAGQLQKSDLIVSRGFSPIFVYRYQLMLFLVRCSFRVRIKFSDPDTAYMYYPPMSMFFSPTSMGGLGRSPTVFPFPADPALSILMCQNRDWEEYILERTKSFNPPRPKDYAEILAKMIMASGKRNDFTVVSKTSPTNIPLADCKKPFHQGVVELSESLDKEGLRNSDECFSKLAAKGISIVNPKLLYKNMPTRMITNVLESNSAVMEFAAEKTKTISADAFVMAKQKSFSESEVWIRSFRFVFGEYPATTKPDDADGPMCYLHPDHSSFFHQVGWGCTTADAERKLTSILNTIKSDPLFPRDVTDEGIMRLLFSPEIAEDPSIAPLVIGSLGASQDTMAELQATFSDASTVGILMQYLAGAFSLTSPCLMQIDRSRDNLSRWVIDLAGNKVSRAAFPAATCYWLLCCYSGGRLDTMVYEPTAASSAFMNKVSTFDLIPYVPVLESSRMYAENRWTRKW